MSRCEREITKEQYNRAKQNYGSITKDDVNDVFSESERLGYGVYSDYVYELDGKFYVSFLLGSTCD